MKALSERIPRALWNCLFSLGLELADALKTNGTGAEKLRTQQGAQLALDAFSERWDDRFPQISRSWRACWPDLRTLLNYPEDSRKAIYTTNAIESLNSVIRKVIKKRQLFASDASAKKWVYLAIREASKKWTLPIGNWKPALNRVMIECEDRLVG